MYIPLINVANSVKNYITTLLISRSKTKTKMNLTPQPNIEVSLSP